MPFAVQITIGLGTVLRRGEAMIAVFILLKAAKRRLAGQMEQAILIR
jgi:hypothetical protein